MAAALAAAIFSAMFRRRSGRDSACGPAHSLAAHRFVHVHADTARFFASSRGLQNLFRPAMIPQ
jgi:hypothetical protein